MSMQRKWWVHDYLDFSLGTNIDRTRADVTRAEVGQCVTLALKRIRRAPVRKVWFLWTRLWRTYRLEVYLHCDIMNEVNRSCPTIRRTSSPLVSGRISRKLFNVSSCSLNTMLQKELSGELSGPMNNVHLSYQCFMCYVALRGEFFFG